MPTLEHICPTKKEDHRKRPPQTTAYHTPEYTKMATDSPHNTNSDQHHGDIIHYSSHRTISHLEGPSIPLFKFLPWFGTCFEILHELFKRFNSLFRTNTGMNSQALHHSKIGSHSIRQTSCSSSFLIRNLFEMLHELFKRFNSLFRTNTGRNSQALHHSKVSSHSIRQSSNKPFWKQK